MSLLPKGTSVQPRPDGTYGDLNEAATAATNGQLRMYRSGDRCPSRPADDGPHLPGYERRSRAAPLPVPRIAGGLPTRRHEDGLDEFRNPLSFEVVKVEGPDAYSSTLGVKTLTEVCRQLSRTAEHTHTASFRRFNEHRGSDDQRFHGPMVHRTFSEMCRGAHGVVREGCWEDGGCPDESLCDGN